MSEQLVDKGMPTPEGPPSGFYVIVPQRSERTRVDLARVVEVLRRAWIVWTSAALVGGIVFAVIAFRLHNVYSSQTLLFPVVPESGVERALGGQLGGLASLVGLDLGGRSGGRESSYATLTSPGLARDFIVMQNLLPVLFFDRWDAKRHAWQEGATIPSLDDAVEKFRTKVFAISEDRRTTVVTVRADWFDPQLAANWANGFVALANDRMRTDAIQKSRRSIEFLEQEAAKTDAVELKQAIYRLIESQINTAMYANLQREYAFRTIDPAVASDPRRKVSPHRALMTLEGAFAGSVLAMSWVLWRRKREWLL